MKPNLRVELKRIDEAYNKQGLSVEDLITKVKTQLDRISLLEVKVEEGKSILTGLTQILKDKKII